MGRPPLPRDQVRSNRVVALVTDREMEELMRGAERSRMSLSAYIRQILVNHQFPITGSTHKE